MFTYEGTISKPLSMAPYCSSNLWRPHLKTLDKVFLRKQIRRCTQTMQMTKPITANIWFGVLEQLNYAWHCIFHRLGKFR